MKLRALILILSILPISALPLELEIKIGSGEFKNKQSTSYQSVKFEHDINDRFFAVGRYQDARISGDGVDDAQSHELHNFNELMGGVGMHITPHIDSYFLADDESYYAAIRGQYDVSKNWVMSSMISHRNRFEGGLKRTQVGMGLGYRLSNHLTITADYETGNFRSDFVSDRWSIGVKYLFDERDKNER